MTFDSANGTGGPLKISIIGAGLVGTFTAILLSKLENVELTVFEKSAELREVGAWISMTHGGLEILKRLVDIEQINSIFYRGENCRTSYTRHWKTGEILHEQEVYGDDPNLVEARTHRVPLHKLLLSYVPSGIIRYDHQVSEIKLGEKNCTINFESRPSHELHLVVVADGIYSKIRRQFFDNAKVNYKGSVAYRTVFPEELIADIPDLHNDTSVWVKPTGDVIFLSRLGLKQYGVVAIVREPEDLAARLRWDNELDILDKTRLKDHFKDWDPVISEVLSRMPEINAFPLGTAPWLNSLTVADKIAFVGDAAHPTAGAYGAGSSFGYADAWALYRSLQETSFNHWSKSNSENASYDSKFALSLFNETRINFLKRVESQMNIDKEVSQRFLGNESKDIFWRWKLSIAKSGGNWMRSHNVELSFQETRDKHLVELFEIFEEQVKESIQ